LKILILVSTLDLSKPFAATPAIWQLLKGLSEEGHELHVLPYSGKGISSLWWKAYENPNYRIAELVQKFVKNKNNQKSKKESLLIPKLARQFVKPKLEKSIHSIFSKEKNIDAVLFIGIPINQVNGLGTSIKNNFNVPIICYDLDLPSFATTFDYFKDANVFEYDSFIIPSEGSTSYLKSLDIKNIHVVHFGVDLEVYSPLDIEKDIDILFFGNGSEFRKNSLKMMVTNPSKKLNYNFVVSGRGLNMDLGNANRIPPFSFTEWKSNCCRSKINLNVVRETHAKVFASSTSRPFELAAMKSCIVSAPYEGIENWFQVGKELLVANSTEECIEIYKMLMDSPELRLSMGNAAYERVKNEHTSRHRARQIIQIIKQYQ